MGKRKGKNKNAKAESSEKSQPDPKARKIVIAGTSAAQSTEKLDQELQEKVKEMTKLPDRPDQKQKEEESEIAQSQSAEGPDQEPKEEGIKKVVAQSSKRPDKKRKEKKMEIVQSQSPERPDQEMKKKKKKTVQSHSLERPDQEMKESHVYQSDDNSMMQISSSMSDLQISEKCPTTSSQVNIPEITAADSCSSSQVVAEISAAQRQEAKEIVDNLLEKMVITPGLPKKLSPGKLGRRVTLTCNWFPIDLLPDGNVYHYDVQIINRKMSEKSDLSTLIVDKNVNRYRCLSTKINRKVIEELLRSDINFKNSYAVYDGRKNLYTPSLLKLKFPYKTDVIVQDKVPLALVKKADMSKNKPSTEIREEDIFKVIIKPVEKKDENKKKTNSCAISFEPLRELFAGRKRDMQEAVGDIQEAMMALETIFRHSPALKFVPIGRNFFHPNLGNLHPLGGGIEIWFGYHQSTRLGQWKPMINLDTTATVFFSKKPLLEYFASFMNVKDLSYYSTINATAVSKMSKELKNIKIIATHQANKRKYNIVEITKQNAATLEFEKEENGKTIKKKVHDYFNEINKKLKYPNLPCVRVRPLARQIYIPLEFCEIVEGQHCNKELNSDEQREMIKYTAQPPKDKFKKIKTIREQHAKYETDDYFKKFNIQVANNPIQVTGRELEAPNLNYKNMKLKPRNGSWNIRGALFFTGVQINSCYLVSLTSERWCNMGALNNFAVQLCKIGQAAGMSLEKPVIDICKDPNNQLLQKFREIKNKNVQLVIIVIPNKDKNLYKNVKQIAEVEIGLMTQCIDHNNVLKSNGSVLANLCQKINAKMGGTNHTLTSGEIPKVMANPVIIMGADVSHAGVTDQNKISVAAVVGSLDMTLSRFAVTCKLQKNENENKMCLEIIEELKVMVRTLLLAFHSHTRQKPAKIIFYRDGVGEGQFSKVKEKELVSIRSACTELQADYKPLITYVVVQKRHHTRFMPADTRQGAGSENNINPGTVVDTEVVHPVHRDFYLCSHYGLKGTSRPAHYTILADDSDFTADEFQVLTHYLCHTFARCTKSISHPVPVRYAHLAAYRVRLLLPPPKGETGTKKKSVLEESKEIPQDILKSVEIQEVLKKRMYFV